MAPRQNACPPNAPVAEARNAAMAPFPNGRWVRLWTVFAAVAAIWLLKPSEIEGPASDPELMLLRESSEAAIPWNARVAQWLRLAHLSLHPAYAWILLAPYVLWLTGRYQLEAGRWQRHALLLGAMGVVWLAATAGYHRVADAFQPDFVVFAMVESRTDLSASGEGAQDHPPGPRFERRISKVLATGHERLPELISEALKTPGSVPGLDPPARSNHFKLSGRARVAGESDVHRRILTNGVAPKDVLLTNRTAHSDFNLDREPLWSRFRRPGGMRLSSMLLDLFAYASLVGVAHALHFHRRFRERERRALALESSLARTRLHALQAQLQPHFLFNSLNSVTSMLREDPRTAEEMLVSLSNLLRLALSQSDCQETPLGDELRFVELYVEVQRYRFGGQLRFETDLHPHAADCLVPTLLLQPLVENAIRHGLEPAGRLVRIRVVARLILRDRLELIVDDDGAGGANVEGFTSPGVGLANVRARLAACFGDEAEFNAASGPEGKGFVVRLAFPAHHAGEARAIAALGKSHA